jgi:hypothetical protein
VILVQPVENTFYIIQDVCCSLTYLSGICFMTQPAGYMFSDQIINEGMAEMSLITDYIQCTIK